METKICPVTGKEFESGTILMDTRLEDSMERKTCTGVEVSPEVQEKIDAGYFPLVVIDVEKSTLSSIGRVTIDGAYRTGEILYVKREVFPKVFGMELPNLPFSFIDQETTNAIKSAISE